MSSGITICCPPGNYDPVEHPWVSGEPNAHGLIIQTAVCVRALLIKASHILPPESPVSDVHNTTASLFSPPLDGKLPEASPRHFLQQLSAGQTFLTKKKKNLPNMILSIKYNNKEYCTAQLTLHIYNFIWAGHVVYR